MVSHYIFKDFIDYVGNNYNGIKEYHSLFNTPKIFFTDLFTSNYAETGEFFGSKSSYWNDLRFNVIYKALAFTNILSSGNYYINSLFFNFAGFIGSVLLYKVFIHVYPTKKWQVIVGCFLLPSTLYFGSGLHKDLIVLTALSMFCYSLYFSLLNGFHRKRIAYLCLSFLTVLLLRNFVAVILLPCAITWVINKKYNFSAIKAFVALIIAGVIGTIALHNSSIKLDPLKIVADRQQAFFALGKANTDYKMDTLQPSFKSFAEQSPTAFRHSFLSPYPNEFNNVFMNLFSAEMICYWVLFCIMLFVADKKLNSSDSFIAFGSTFAILMLLFTGYITPAAGALIRYRSIYFPFLITTILCNINWKRIYNF